MRVGLISDVHGNRVALDAVLEDMPPVDALASPGDVVGYGPWPAACVEAMRSRDVPTVEGNHDRAVVTESTFRFRGIAREGIEYAREHLDDEQLDWLSDLPTERIGFDGRVKLVHGHPDDPDRYTYPGEFSPTMLGEEDVLVLGHTHVQGYETFEEGIVVNPGSVGQPRDKDPRAAYAVVDLDAMTVEEHRVGYDVDEVVKAVRAAGLSEEIGTRLYEGR